MVWFTIWFLVILKIPVLYLAWVIWWAVKDPPMPEGGAEDAFGDEGGPGWRPQEGRRRRGRGGPHGSPLRRGNRTQPVPVRGRR